MKDLATRNLRRLNIEPAVDAPETVALYEMLRSHIDDTVVRAQRNLDREHAAAGWSNDSPLVVYARGDGRAA